jgi:lipid-binding SYLF domain-containing protein
MLYVTSGEAHVLRSSLVLVCLVGTAAGAEERGADRRLEASAEVVRDMTRMPDRGIPRDLIHKARCVVVIPGLKKGAFVVGGEYGKGFASCRTSPRGAWGAPAAVELEGGSFGFQLGGSSTDVIMLVMNDRGLEHLLQDKVSLGGEAEVAAGPVGRNAAADTDISMHAEILTWSRSRGIFAGISLTGAVLHSDVDENEKLYGHRLHSREVLRGNMRTPAVGRVFVSALNRS